MGGSESSRFIVKLIEGSNPETALKDSVIIKQVTLGISNIDDSKILANLYPKGYVHTALYISDQDPENFEEKGILLEYGKYDAKENKDYLIKYEYMSGGMRYGWVEIKEFQKNLASSASINLKIRPLLLFKDLISKLKENDNWDLNSYSSIHHNCQDFCAKAINILKASYDSNAITIKDNIRHKYGKKKDIIPICIQKALGIL